MNGMAVMNRGVVLNVHVVPRSSRNAVQGLHGDAVKIRLQAPPVEGKANEALVRFLSQVLGIPPRQVSLLSGASGRKKRVLISGLGKAEVRVRLGIN